MKKKILSVLSLLMFLLVMAGCDAVSSITGEATLSSLALSKSSATVTQGSSYTLPAVGTVTYSDGTTSVVSVTWDKTVSTATAGTTVYTATYSEEGITVSAIFMMTVEAKEVEAATLSSIELPLTTATMTVGDSYTLPTIATALYSNGSTKTVMVTWNKAVSTLVAGTAVYTASYTENGVRVEAMFVLTVKQPEVEVKLSSLVLETTTATVTQGDSYNLSTIGTATYSNGTTKTVVLTWNKTVSTTTAGTTTYTASYTESGVTKTATFTLTVEAVVITAPAFTIEDVTVALNGTVEVTVKASGFTENVTGIDLRLYADSTYLTFVSAEFVGNAAGGLTIAKAESTSNYLAATITNSDAGVLLDGNIVKFKFTAINSGSTTVKMTSSTLLDVYSLKITDTDVSDTAKVTIQ